MESEVEGQREKDNFRERETHNVNTGIVLDVHVTRFLFSVRTISIRMSSSFTIFRPVVQLPTGVHYTKGVSGRLTFV